MSDLMFYGVLQMPYEMAMSDEISRFQFYSRVQEAVRRLQAAEAALAASQTCVAKPELPVKTWQERTEEGWRMEVIAGLGQAFYRSERAICHREAEIADLRAALSASGQTAQAAKVEAQFTQPDYSEMSRDALERHAARMAQALASDTERKFYNKHATGPMLPPSCFCCGKLPNRIAIRHMELPGIVVCEDCRSAALSPAPHPSQVAQDKPKIVPDWEPCNEGCERSLPHGGYQDCRDERCDCDPAKDSIARQRAAIAAIQPKPE
ncbi:hypothetical protein ACHMW6_06085 [Pseudoduganella sp. UC29_106]|uniref:hypothetical protein n=1 Tax=Pseudoduganella sp. UC29_106 TaxID=3374553 RepID=UPI003757C82B